VFWGIGVGTAVGVGNTVAGWGWAPLSGDGRGHCSGRGHLCQGMGVGTAVSVSTSVRGWAWALQWA